MQGNLWDYLIQTSMGNFRTEEGLKEVSDLYIYILSGGAWTKKIKRKGEKVITEENMTRIRKIVLILT